MKKDNLKTFIIYIGGHEENHYYTLKGTNLKDAIKRSFEEKDYFFENFEGEDINKVYKTIINGDIGEEVTIFQSDSEIKEITK